MKKLWEKSYKSDPQIEKFTVGDDPLLDLKLIKYDCLASIAHAKMLGKISILKKNEVNQLVKELQNIISLTQNGKFIILQEQEDCHTAIENYLTEKLGDLGKKIHTARSRNDQVLAALRLYYKAELGESEHKINQLISKLKDLKKKKGKIKFPGYTHTRKAMASSVELWCDGYSDSMEDNLILIHATSKLIDQSPLGTGAGYGVPLDVDREFAARQAGFSRIQKNPIAVQNSRGKFESSLVHALSQVMLDLNRMATDLIFFTLPGLEYFEIPDAFCTGSSIMPQKKNPDVLELIRAKYHTVISREFQLKSTIANLISGYHRDLQTTKKPVIEVFDITLESLSIMHLIIKNLKINEDHCKNALTDEVFATEKVYDLVKQGIPFREAYKKISKLYE
jgi:argininosuccinate lyase